MKIHARIRSSNTLVFFQFPHKGTSETQERLSTGPTRGCCGHLATGSKVVEWWVVTVLDDGVHGLRLLQLKEQLFHGLNGVITAQIYHHLFNLRRKTGHRDVSKSFVHNNVSGLAAKTITHSLPWSVIPRSYHPGSWSSCCLETILVSGLKLTFSIAHLMGMCVKGPFPMPEFTKVTFGASKYNQKQKTCHLKFYLEKGFHLYKPWEKTERYFFG